MAVISSAAIQTLGQETLGVWSASLEEIGAFTYEFNSTLGMGDTMQVPVFTAGTIAHMADYTGTGAASLALKSVALNKRYGEVVPFADEVVSNLGPGLKKGFQREIIACIAAALSNGHSLVTAANFPLVTGIGTAAASTWTLATFQANLSAVAGLNKLDPNNLFFVATPVMYLQLAGGLNSVMQQDDKIRSAIINGTSFRYLGCTIIKSTNLPATIKGGYFCDGSHIAIGIGVDKLDQSAQNAPELEVFVDDVTGLGYSIRTWYSPEAGAKKIVPQIITGAAVVNPNGCVIPTLT